LRDIVELVDRDQDTRSVVPCDLSQLDEESRKIHGQITRVCGTEHGVDVDSDFRTIGETDREGLQYPERARDPFPDPRRSPGNLYVIQPATSLVALARPSCCHGETCCACQLK